MKRILKKVPFFYLAYKKLQYRRLTRKNKLAGDSLLQSASTTELNRHPDIFNELKTRFGKEDIRVLSFGCSTGEECKSLSEYLPEAKIVGIDINKKSIENAQANYASENVQFILKEPKDLRLLGKFDVIIAISVLCKHPEAELINDISSIFPFDKYESIVSSLDQLLNEEGLLFIRSSNFRFKDTRISDQYEVVSWNSRNPEPFPKFDSNNVRIDGFEEREELFRKKH